MFEPYMAGAWIVGGIVALMAGTVGFFVVLRGSTFEAHTVPLGAFPGAAAATLLGIDRSVGLLAFSLAAVAGIALLSRRDDSQVATALSLVVLLGLGALLLSLTTAYAPAVNALLFGELLGIGADDVGPAAVLGVVSVAATSFLFRPLLLLTVSPELGAARGLRPRLLHLLFLGNVALAAAAALPLVGALLVFALMVGPASAARALTNRPLPAMAMSAALALGMVWLAIALSFLSNWPVGFFVGTGGAVCYGAGRLARASATRGGASGFPAGHSRDPSDGGTASVACR